MLSVSDSGGSFISLVRLCCRPCPSNLKKAVLSDWSAVNGAVVPIGRFADMVESIFTANINLFFSQEKHSEKEDHVFFAVMAFSRQGGRGD
jgi:hypothetical protein